MSMNQTSRNDESENATSEYYYKFFNDDFRDLPFTVRLTKQNFLAVAVMSVINVALSLLTLRCLFP